MNKYILLILLAIAFIPIACSDKKNQEIELTKEQKDSIVVAQYCDFANDFLAPVMKPEQAPKEESIISPPGHLYQGMTFKECIEKWGTPKFCKVFNDQGHGKSKGDENYYCMCLEEWGPLYASGKHSHIFASWNVNINQFRGLEIEFVVVGNQAYAFAAYYYTSWDDEKLWEYPCA